MNPPINPLKRYFVIELNCSDIEEEAILALLKKQGIDRERGTHNRILIYREHPATMIRFCEKHLLGVVSFSLIVCKYLELAKAKAGVRPPQPSKEELEEAVEKLLRTYDNDFSAAMFAANKKKNSYPPNTVGYNKWAHVAALVARRKSGVKAGDYRRKKRK